MGTGGQRSMALRTNKSPIGPDFRRFFLNLGSPGDLVGWLESVSLWLCMNLMVSFRSLCSGCDVKR
jgi:hypothetical protein